MPLHYTERPDRENLEWQKWGTELLFSRLDVVSSMKNPELHKQTSISGANTIKNGQKRRSLEGVATCRCIHDQRLG